MNGWTKWVIGALSALVAFMAYQFLSPAFDMIAANRDAHQAMSMRVVLLERGQADLKKGLAEVAEMVASIQARLDYSNRERKMRNQYDGVNDQVDRAYNATWEQLWEDRSREAFGNGGGQH